MKTIILVLFGLIALSSATGLLKHKSHAHTRAQTRFREVNIEDLSDESEDSLYFGIEKVIEAARKDEKVDADDEFTIVSIEAFSEEVNGKRAVNHVFKVVLTDNNDSILSAAFSVIYVSFSGYKSINFYKYKVVNTRVAPSPQPTGAWEDVDIENDADVDAIVQQTVQEIVSRGNQNNKIPDGEYYALEATVRTQTMTSGTNYQGTVELHNGKTVDLIVNFVVYESPEGETTITQSTYKASGVPVKGQFGNEATVIWFERN